VYQQLRLEDVLGTFHVGADELCGCVPAGSTIEARAEIVRLRAGGLGATAIAQSLNRRAVPTPTGRGRWWPETVKRHVDPGPWRDYMRRYRIRRPR
jgi:hypothetical protein